MASQALIHAQEPDLSLLRRFTETGDRDAFAEIVRRYTGVVYAASHRILGDEARAQDVSQETFFRLMQRPKLVTQSLGGWLHRAATHLAIDAKRSEVSRRNREKSYFATREAQAREGQGGREPKWEEVSPYVDQALIDLPEPTRTLLVRHFLQGTPQADLAAEASASPATISRKIKAGVEELQKLLRKKGIYVALFALTDFCTRETAKAAPPQLISELGKMRMVGRLKLTSSYPTNSAASTKMLAALLSGAALVAMIGIAAMILTSRPHHTPPPHPDDNSPAVVKTDGAK